VIDQKNALVRLLLSLVQVAIVLGGALSVLTVQPARADSESNAMGVGGRYRDPNIKQIRHERRRERIERQQVLKREEKNARRGPHAFVHDYGSKRGGNQKQSATTEETAGQPSAQAQQTTQINQTAKKQAAKQQAAQQAAQVQSRIQASQIRPR
jgi:hypothetical protein